MSASLARRRQARITSAKMHVLNAETDTWARNQATDITLREGGARANPTLKPTPTGIVPATARPQKRSRRSKRDENPSSRADVRPSQAEILPTIPAIPSRVLPCWRIL